MTIASSVSMSPSDTVASSVDSTKRTRKRRIVKGGYIDLDDVSNAANADYGNWIFHARIKLAEREYKLTELRVERVRQVIFENIAVFELRCQPFGVSLSPQFTDKLLCSLWNGKVLDNVMFELHEVLAAWEGVHMQDAKKGVTSFRGYFDASRNWFDQKKKRYKATLFWLPVLQLVQQLALQSSVTVFSEDYPELQYKSYNLLLQQVLYGLFTAQITFAATKAQPLIPCGTLKDMKPIKQFLLKFLGDGFDVQAMVNKYKKDRRDANDEDHPRKGGKAKVGAAQITQFLRCNLKEVLVQSEQLFVEALHKHCVKVEGAIEANNTDALAETSKTASEECRFAVADGANQFSCDSKIPDHGEYHNDQACIPADVSNYEQHAQLQTTRDDAYLWSIANQNVTPSNELQNVYAEPSELPNEQLPDYMMSDYDDVGMVSNHNSDPFGHMSPFLESISPLLTFDEL
eukprot:CAMPEP_0202686950 /NCGR_PEP_ID=MMETSP1385-20130828/2682_1 /ASSEMBLY_ACC=CAM_ASM_000861 /TAXON_ID=933848 /ORGANISM="Elphidium margaritaceum" /LENGTH=459 /DNA_ID=CAMNT_0049341635 /DNA_START=393 /DNA_END=1772 /DNA_ORIENTATION=+